MAVKEGRESPDEEQFGDFSCTVLDNPLDGNRAEDAALGRHPDRRQERLVAEHRRDRRERGLKGLEDMEG